MGRHGTLYGVSLDRHPPRRPNSRLAQRRARQRMMRRRRRAAFFALLILVTGGWVWHAVQGPPAATDLAEARVIGLPHADAALLSQLSRAIDPLLATVASPFGAGSPTSHPKAVTAGSGRLEVVPGTGRVHGTGPLKLFIVEVEGGLGEDPQAFADLVDQTLTDPRSWGNGGRLSFQRVASGPVAFRVTLASPATVDRLCAALNTNGYTSCYDSHGRAVLNQARWETGVPWYADDMTTYRRYMINHEVGHALGHSHVFCPRPGALAPTMQQQTLGMQGCRANPWPYP